jgi:hypothetical protein
MLKRIVTGALVLLSLYVGPAYGDRGRILTYDTDADVRENSQKAIILHNFEEEVLILGTDLQADMATTILEFIPFPSEPMVTLAEGDPFQRVSELIGEHKLVFIHYHHSKGSGGMSSETPVEIVHSARLGAHDVTVIRVDDSTGFSTWVKTFLGSRGLSPGADYHDVEAVASDYVKRGINYFVFDLVDLKPGAQSVKPLVYRFKSRLMYYPLKTSNTFGNSGGIDLIIIAPGTLCDPSSNKALYSRPKAFSYRNFCMNPLSTKNPAAVRVSTSAEISIAQTESIYAPAGQFFPEKESIFMQLISYFGEYNFDDDLLIDILPAPPRAMIGEPYVYVPPGELSPGDYKHLDKIDNKKQATMSAIEMEIERFEQRLTAAKEGPGDSQNIPDFEKRIEKLRTEGERLKKNRCATLGYPLPERKTVRVKVTHPYAQGSLLELVDMTRSGPFYHVAGIKGDNYKSLKPNETYRVWIDPVYPRDYPFPSYYVYIEDFK